MAELTATIITYNEEQNIQACLENLTWVKEIVVVDSGSSDRTLEICRGYTDKVFLNPWPGHVQQKNVAISLATHDWILSIDADERVPVELREAIDRELSAPCHAGYCITRRNYFLGRWMRHGGWYPDRVLRLFDRRKGQFGGLNPHDRVVISDGSIGVIDGHLIHLTYRDFSQYLRKQDWYTGISAEGRVSRGRRPGSVTRAELALRALVKFMQVYLLKRGFLDGMPGLIAAVGAAYFNFIKYAKVWELGAHAERAPRSEERRYDETTLEAPIIGGAGGIMRNPIDHFAGLTVHRRLKEIDIQTVYAERETMARRLRVGWLDVTLRPAVTFFKIYLLKQGFRDGLHGLVYATLASFYTFVRYAKAWELLREGQLSVKADNLFD